MRWKVHLNCSDDKNMNPPGNKTGKPPIWGTILYLPQAGCYEMTVSWQSGQWHLLFAAGR
ncbi:MAG TPA: hypothetical protein VJO32_15110 [Ktedonobacteraceae bacterium]|nr:hypothetical protein [Ktedonobacteraceae bacterium]